MRLKDKKIVIVGGSSGFGRRVAELALAQGAQLLIGGRNPERLESAIAELKKLGAVEGCEVDAADVESLKRFLEKVESFDHLISMVGGAMGGGFLDADFAQIHEALEQKLFDNLRLARLAAPLGRAGGSMIFTGGSGGRPHTASGAYLGNQAILTMAESLASELAPKLRVNVVAPTWTETPFWRAMPEAQRASIKKYFCETIPLGRTATIDEVASVYVFLMENEFITGQQIAVDGGVTLRM